MSRVLVLGANGFLGSHIVDSLIASGYSVRAFDRFSNQDIRFIENENIELFSGDFLNRSDIRKALNGVEYVFHLVSTTNPATAEADPLIDIDTNIKGSVALFQDCVASGRVKRVLYASSGGTVYGEHDSSEPINESEPTLPVSPYGIGKLTIENYLRYFSVKEGLESVSFRIANPYGERQPLMRKQGVIPIFLEKIMKGEEVTILGDGSMVRDYIYVKDVADMMVETLAHTPKYDVYNIGSGRGSSVSEIVDTVAEVTGLGVKSIYKSAPKTFIHTSVLDTSRYDNEFGRHNHTSLRDGVGLTCQYLRNDLGIIHG